MTSKLQLTVPKVIADQYGIRPGDELKWIPAGDSIRVELVGGKVKTAAELTTEEKLGLFDASTKRVDKLHAEALRKNKGKRITLENRGWTREELYGDCGFPR